MNRIDEIFDKHHPRTQMSETETMAMLNIMLSKDPAMNTDVYKQDETSDLYQHFKPLFDEFVFKVFLSKIKHFTTLRISLGAFIMLSLRLESPGNATMYAYYLHRKLPAGTLVTINDIAAKLFPWGFFSEEQLNLIWSEQKTNKKETANLKCVGSSDNLLDYIEMWEK